MSAVGDICGNDTNSLKLDNALQGGEFPLTREVTRTETRLMIEQFRLRFPLTREVTRTETCAACVLQPSPRFRSPARNWVRECRFCDNDRLQEVSASKGDPTALERFGVTVQKIRVHDDAETQTGSSSSSSKSTQYRWPCTSIIFPLLPPERTRFPT